MVLAFEGIQIFAVLFPLSRGVDGCFAAPATSSMLIMISPEAKGFAWDNVRSGDVLTGVEAGKGAS